MADDNATACKRYLAAVEWRECHGGRPADWLDGDQRVKVLARSLEFSATYDAPTMKWTLVIDGHTFSQSGLGETIDLAEQTLKLLDANGR